jgi:membrane protein implicated in regulation of membrane protease activity
MDASTLWWLAAALAVAAELLTGTFYLLMAALGLAAGALAAHAGLGDSAQLLATALVGGGAVAIWSLLRPRRSPASGHDPAQSLDIGQSVQVTAWQADGSARVHYRGTLWSARWGEPGPLPAPGHYVIRALHGNELLLGR